MNECVESGGLPFSREPRRQAAPPAGPRRGRGVERSEALPELAPDPLRQHGSRVLLFDERSAVAFFATTGLASPPARLQQSPAGPRSSTKWTRINSTAPDFVVLLLAREGRRRRVEVSRDASPGRMVSALPGAGQPYRLGAGSASRPPSLTDKRRGGQRWVRVVATGSATRDWLQAQRPPRTPSM